MDLPKVICGRHLLYIADIADIAQVMTDGHPLLMGDG